MRKIEISRVASRPRNLSVYVYLRSLSCIINRERGGVKRSHVVVSFPLAFKFHGALYGNYPMCWPANAILKMVERTIYATAAISINHTFCNERFSPSVTGKSMYESRSDQSQQISIKRLRKVERFSSLFTKHNLSLSGNILSINYTWQMCV